MLDICKEWRRNSVHATTQIKCKTINKQQQKIHCFQMRERIYECLITHIYLFNMLMHASHDNNFNMFDVIFVFVNSSCVDCVRGEWSK